MQTQVFLNTQENDQVPNSADKADIEALVSPEDIVHTDTITTTPQRKPLSPISNLKMAMRKRAPASPLKNIESILRSNKSLEDEKDIFQSRIEELERENQRLQEILDGKDEEIQRIEQSWTTKNEELLKSITNLQEKIAQNEAEEMDKLRALKSEREKLAKENQALTKKLERSEGYLEVSKELANNLQQEKRTFSEKLKFCEKQIQEKEIELDRVRAQNLEFQERVSVNEKKLHKVDEHVESSRNEVTNLEKQLFLTLALAIKLNYHIHNDGCYSNVCIARLSEEVVQKNIPKSEWYTFIVDAILAEAVTLPLPTTATTITTTIPATSPKCTSKEKNRLVRKRKRDSSSHDNNYGTTQQSKVSEVNKSPTNVISLFDNFTGGN